MYIERDKKYEVDLQLFAGKFLTIRLVFIISIFLVSVISSNSVIAINFFDSLLLIVSMAHTIYCGPEFGHA